MGFTMNEMLKIGLLAFVALTLVSAQDVRAQDQAPAEVGARPQRIREGYIITVELPLVGNRDERVRQQILRIANTAKGNSRPIVVLKFQTVPLDNVGEPDNGGVRGGSQFGRAADLAKFMCEPDASRVELIAYLPKTVEGHAVLPVLACEQIYAAPDAELGRIGINGALDPNEISAYVNMVARKPKIPEAVVMTMLDPKAEAYQIRAEDGWYVVDRPELDRRTAAGEVLEKKLLWQGGSLAAYTGEKLRSEAWIEPTIDDASAVASALGLNTSLRTIQQLPREWKATSITISGSLPKSRIRQLMRAMNEAVRSDQVNLFVFNVSQAKCNFADAWALANEITELGRRDEGGEVYTLSIVSENIVGPTALIAVACDEAVLLPGVTLGPAVTENAVVVEDAAQQRAVNVFAQRCGRPTSLLAALIDPQVVVREYIHQASGKREIFTDWLLAEQEDAREIWGVKTTIAGGGEPIPTDVALRYRLIDSVDESPSLALSRLGVEQSPTELSTPWLDATIQVLLAQPWVPRLLLTLGFFALMAELGNPGIGAGGFLAAVCFLGFFWIEGLNGNVEALEIILFVAGLVALAIEIFVIPGFGLFGIGGLLMVFVSVVLASQTFIWPTTSAQLGEVSVNLFWVACLALGSMIGLLFMHKQLERLPMFRWISLQPGGADDLDELDAREAIAHRDHLLGQDGLTTTRLNPSGKAQFGYDIVAVVGTGKLIDEGTPVRVVEVRGNLVFVEESE
jgi:membrane-bound serine protease (ClpP class)